MTPWNLSGTYFEACNCEAACPCIFTSPPTEGECKAMVAWHIDKGAYAETSLDGLNIALAVHAPGTMVATKWRVAAYFDDKATAAQSEALHAIFGGKSGGHPAVLASFIGEMVGAKSVPMVYSADGRKSSLSIPGVAEAHIEQLDGQGGGPITIEGHPLCIAPGKSATVARSSHFNLDDFDWSWKFSGKSGLMSPFAYASD
ncbi:DUF1326 domain-containing protein [Hydrogenophaga sp. PAMC20947]|uniref:DUF1326 domain-containing protein n=1 Tax=Hydrogenophaga sp. PAMC20947 TaxID=2565558 RepID=UPI00109D8BF1|nr:DUF1326 domain-containing protein [Hydrogenophaga sp. PAMC20947]QCB44586.1 DUF1326 domain-containing protein [Hydrogenophaga sp. PAMC20947]